MNYFFSTSEPALLSAIEKHASIKTSAQYNLALLDIIASAPGILLQNTASTLFSKELRQINQSQPLSEKTPWGGVVLKKVDVERDFIQKLLVIQELGVLGFEIHLKKLEKLRILEGTCLVLYSNHKKNRYKKRIVTVTLAKASDRFVFHPKNEHGIIALTNCVIEETSTNHLDDLVYIFKAQQVKSYDT